MALDEYTTSVLQKLRLDAQNRPFYTPALMAYLRGVGLSLSQAEDTRAQNRGEAQRSYQQRNDTIERDYAQGRRTLAGRLQARGILRSGESNQRFNEQDQARARASNTNETDRANRLSAIDNAYNRVEDTLRQQTTEQLLQAEQADADRRAQEAAQLRQQESLLNFYKGKK